MAGATREPVDPFRQKQREAYRRHYLTHKDQYSLRARRQHLAEKYGVSLEFYDARYAELDGRCASCGLLEISTDPRNGKVRNLAVDHNHETGEIRDLICNACNTSLGLLKEDPERMEALAAYIRKHTRS